MANNSGLVKNTKAMERRFELVENERQSFVAPVEIRWTTPDGTMHCSSGRTVDASVYGLGVIVSKQIGADTQLMVCIGGTLLCGMGNVRYSHPVENGFRMGLQFQTTLVMRGIAELDSVLMTSLKPKTKEWLQQLRQVCSYFKTVAVQI